MNWCSRYHHNRCGQRVIERCYLHCFCNCFSSNIMIEIDESNFSFSVKAIDLDLICSTQIDTYFYYSYVHRNPGPILEPSHDAHRRQRPPPQPRTRPPQQRQQHFMLLHVLGCISIAIKEIKLQLSPLLYD